MLWVLKSTADFINRFSKPWGYSNHVHLALIQPPSLVRRSNYLSYVAIPPLWLGYLTASAREAGHTVQVVDAIGAGLNQFWRYRGKTLRGLDFHQIVSAIPPETTVVGLTCMFSCAWPIVRDLSFAIHTARPDLTLILGGEHATALPDEVLAESPFDILIKGEGEETLLALLKALENHAPLSAVAGISYRDHQGLIHHNPRRGRIRQINDIPPPDWHDVNVEGYIALKSPHGAQMGRSMPMLLSRGCPYQCTFCTSPNMWTTTWQARDVDCVLDEMESYIHRYGVTDFHFEDLTAVIQKKWILDFSEKILARGLNITWQLPTGTRSEAFDGEIAHAMFESGCKNFAFAIESGDPAVLKRIQKRMTPERMFKAARASMAQGLRVQGLFIYGFPFETPLNWWRTWLTILKCAVLGFSEVNISAFFPMPGTVEFDRLRTAGKITLNDDFYFSLFDYLTLFRHTSFNPRLPSWGLRALVLFSFISFFSVSWLLRPWRLLRELFVVSQGRTQSKVMRILKSMLTLKQFRATRTLGDIPPPPDFSPGEAATPIRQAL